MQIVWFDMKHITFIQILKPPGNMIGKMQTSEGRGDQADCMQCYRTREEGMLLSYRPCMADKSEANAAGKLDTRSESRERAFDHHDMLDTWMPGVVVIGLFYTYLILIQAVIAVEG